MFASRGNMRSKALSIFIVFSILVSFFPVALSFPAHVEAATTLKVYPAPSGVALNADFTAQVREPGGVWKGLDEYRTTVGHPTKSNASFVYFDTDGQVEMSVTYNAGTITSTRIRGLNTEITPTINGNTMTFAMSGPMKLSVEVNGELNRNIMIFANPLEVNPPSPTDPNVIYLGPGLYQQNYTVPSGKTLYIAGGAVVQGGIDMSNATNVKVIGRGVIDRPQYVGIIADYANQVTIDGVIVNNYGYGNNGGYSIMLGNATNVLVNNYKTFGINKWGDGIDAFAATNVTINDSYIRSHDDSIAIYNARNFGGKVYYGNTKNITVSNSILQPDLARPINIGTHGFPWAPGGGHTIENLTFSNLDLWIHNSGHRIQFISADGNLIQNVNFSDIRINDTVQGRFLIMDVKKWDYGVGRGINNVHFKNVSYTGSNDAGNPITGYDSSRMIQNITFENLKINGTVITNAAEGNITPNGYTRNINFIASGDPVPVAPPEFPSPAPINLALNRPASASSSQAGNPASSGNDGSTSTRWCAVDGSTGQWWTVDLGSSKNITRGTQVMWEQSGKAYQYKIETSNDNVNWTLQVDKTNNTSTDQIQNDPFYETARYVRITVTGLPTGAWASFYDFKVLGETVNLAENKASSTDSILTGFPVSSGVDGNSITRWSAADQAAGHWVQVDLGYIKNISYGTQVSFEKSGVAYQYKIETSKDNTNWTLKVDKTANTSTEQVQTDYFTDSARYVRITVTGVPSGANASFYDFKVFGEDPVNLALGKHAFTDSADPANPAANGNDFSTSTRWSAGDANPGHWWAVDLGSSRPIAGSQVMWEKLDTYYKYKIETSDDNVNWTQKVDKGGNGINAQVQFDSFAATARYVRITVTGVSSGDIPSFYDFKVFGETGDTVTMAQLQFDETSGTTAIDATGNGRHGTLVGGVNRVSGKSGSAVDLSGTNQYVALPAGVVSNYDAITVAAWVNLDTASNWTRIFDFGSGTATNMFLTPKNGVNGKIRFGIKYNGSAEQIIDGQAALPTGGWHHVAVTLNGPTGTLYVNGVQVGINNAMTLKPSTLGATTQNWIGRSQYPDPYLDGRVDDFRIYNRALTASEVTHVMEGQTALPIAELPFNETSGTTATDVSGNGWNGTLTGSATWVTGNSGNAVDLNGTNGYVALPAGVVSGADTTTIAAWVNLDTVSNWSRIFDIGSGTSKYMFLTPKSGATGNIRFEIKNGSAVNSVDATAAFAAGGWHHVAVTLDGATGTIYVDGQKVGSGGVNIRPSQLGVTTQNWIGRSQWSVDPYLDGRVDEFRIYNRALSAEEVSLVMNGDEPTIPTGLSAEKLSNSAIKLNWMPSLNAASYNVKRATVSGGPYTTIASVANPAYTDEGLTPDTTYYYVVSAVSPGHESANSQEVFKSMASNFAANQDIGSTGLAGSTTNNGTQTVLQGSGADIWDIADAFQFAYSPVTGDQTIIARVSSQTNTNGWAKAGLMIRESLDANAKNVLVAITPSNGAIFQYRAATGGTTSNVSTAGPVAPYWLKLVRTGNTFTGYISSNGTAWTLLGSTTVSMSSAAYIGLAVSSHDNTKLSTVEFDNILVK
ncbi:LamG-like jellyroll fold domain-containing protein [Cohnella sp.]|uniref:LamG-like jellyroll fold domain-containing protein n=1 Tax=Cohnella sp. TaxID=1883426 RepID=UPI00356374EE